MMNRELASDEKRQAKRPETETPSPEKQQPEQGAASLLHLQQQVGNRAVQRLLAQRSGGDGAFELDEATTGRINQARGGGQPLDGAVQKQMSEGMGHDFSGVRVHTSNEANDLNQQLSAKAFTTGQDIFFKAGEYDPGSSGGRELIAHELTHVVQQSSGLVGGSGDRMTVNPPGDVYEQEADAVAKQATGEPVQRQAVDDEELQMKADETIQRQEVEGEELDEEDVQMKADETVQRQAVDDEELQMKADEAIQRQAPDEEELAA
jgi:hypothetical protein